MKKFFIYFILLLSIIPVKYTLSGVDSISTPVKKGQVDPKSYNKQLENLYKELPNINNKQEVANYIKKRMSFITPATTEEKENLHNSESTSIVDLEKLKQNQQNTLSAYEKIYEQSMERATSGNRLDENIILEGTFYREKKQEQAAPFVPDFPYVTIKLSEEQEILAPAEEHIAYFLTDIKIEQIGLIKVTENITFVSNNEGFPQGFFRILPKYTYSRFGKKRRLDLTLESVTINDEEYSYKVTEIGNYLHIEPQNPISLPTGIYTYKFNYIIDRSIWQYENFDEFYWDVTARTIKNVVGSANALVILPKEKSFMAQNATVSTTGGGLDYERVTITSLSSNSLGFADTEALGVGEDIHILITLDKDTLLPPTSMQKYLWFIQDYGKELFAILVLIALYISYKISLKQIRQNKDKIKAFIKKTPSNWRMINQNVFDQHSFGAEILNLCAKGVVELTNSNDKIILIKKTDDLKKLSKTEKQLLSYLFPGQETTLTSGKESSLKLKRAYKFLKQKTTQKLINYKLRLISSYFLSGFIMMLLGYFATSYLSTNTSHTLVVLIIVSILISPLIFITQKTFKNRYLNIIAKLICIILTLFIASFMAIYTSTLYTIIVILCIYTIFYYLNLFSRRNGLMRYKIKETEEYKTYLQKNTELQLQAKDFITKAPYIYAFELENKYKDTSIFKEITILIDEIK